MRRLYDCLCIDAADLLYAIPAAGAVAAVFDGDLLLEGNDRPLVDQISRRIKLRRPPVSRVRCLIDDTADRWQAIAPEIERLRDLIRDRGPRRIPGPPGGRPRRQSAAADAASP